MNIGILTSTRCLAVSFKQEYLLPPCTYNVYELFKAFQHVNTTLSTSSTLRNALRNCSLMGHIEPFVTLVGGDESSLRIIKASWMRAQLHPPPGFRIDSIGRFIFWYQCLLKGDASGLVLNSVPQFASMRLEEVIFQVLCQMTNVVEPSCSEARLYAAVQSIYADMQIRQAPSKAAVQRALGTLIKSGLIYFCGKFDMFMHLFNISYHYRTFTCPLPDRLTVLK